MASLGTPAPGCGGSLVLHETGRAHLLGRALVGPALQVFGQDADSAASTPPGPTRQPPIADLFDILRQLEAFTDSIGTVKELGVRSTDIQTFDGAEVIVPNADFIAKTLINWTKSNRRRRPEIDVGVAYGNDPAKVIEILESVANANDYVMKDPAATCGGHRNSAALATVASAKLRRPCFRPGG